MVTPQSASIYHGTRISPRSLWVYLAPSLLEEHESDKSIFAVGPFMAGRRYRLIGAVRPPSDSL